ncbi:MAG: F-box protein [Methylophilaceae bacterium]
MLERNSVNHNEPDVELDAIESDDEQNDDAETQPAPMQLTDLPDELLLQISRYLPSLKDKARLASVCACFYGLFKEDGEAQAAQEAAECVIYPTQENIEKLKRLLKIHPALLLRPVTVTNRHGMAIKGTVYQIALHECDNELIEDVLLKEGFTRLKDGENVMESQRQQWLPEGWREKEDRAYVSAFNAIDNLFAKLISATHPDDVTELPQYPYTITINHQGANQGLEDFREAIDALYRPASTVITSGRDPSIRLFERFLDLYRTNYDNLCGYTPRNNVLMRAVFGYCQRYAPINFMQAFAQGVAYMVENMEKLKRSFEYRCWPGNFIVPIDSDPRFRLGHEFFASVGGRSRGRGFAGTGGGGCYRTFFQSKTAAALQSCVTQPRERSCVIQ